MQRQARISHYVHASHRRNSKLSGRWRRGWHCADLERQVSLSVSADSTNKADGRSFELQGSWSLFAFPVQSIALLDMAQAGSLQNHLFCVSQAGTVGIIALQEMEQ